MTQTPPKFGSQSNTNGYNSIAPSLQTRNASSKNASSQVSAAVEASQTKKASFWQNLSIKWKLALLLVTGAALPVIGVTQGIVWYNQQNAQKHLEETVKSNAVGFSEDYLGWLALEGSGQVDTIAKIIESTNIDLQNPQQVQANRLLLESLTSIDRTEAERPDSWKSFRIIANAQGKSVAQYLRLHNDYPLGTAVEERSKNLEKISLPTNIDLKGLPIVQDALRSKRPFKGIVVLDRAIVRKLGLGEQLKGSETDTDIKGLAAIAVEPIEISGNVVGVAIAGTLLNSGHILVDTFQEYYGSEVSVYQGDTRISTTIPASDGKNRANGELASTKVTQAVLEGGKELSLQETIGGTPYLTYYVPLYDYRGKKTKPVGMMAVGTAPKTLNNTIEQTRNVGYGIGFGILLLAGALAIPIAESFSRPIKKLQDVARKIAIGEKVAGLTESDRQDEIGVLSQELNRMATQIEVSLDAFRQETAREQLLKEVTLALSQYPQVSNTFEKALEVLRLDFDADRAFFYRFNEQTLAGEVVAESLASGFPRALGALITDPCFNDRMAEEYRRGRIQAITNIYESDLTECHIKMLEPFAIKAHLVVPVLRGSRRLLAGLLVVNQCSRSRVWQSSEIDLLVQVATQLGLALDRANLIEKTTATAERAQAIKDITLKLAQTSDPTTIFETVVGDIRTALRSDRVIIYQFDANWKGTVIAESVALGFPQALGAEIADPCFADRYVEKYKQGRVQATPDIERSGLTECHLKQLEPFKVRANLVAPILVGGELPGLLIAHQCSEPRNWDTTEIDFFTQLSTQIGLSLEKANLLERQRSEKENLQKRALELLKQVDPISRGDLTIRASVTEDEIGTVADSYNSTVESLRKIVAQVKTAAKQMTVTTGQNQTSVKSLSQEALRQAQEVTVALERIQAMTNSIREVTANAKKAEVVVRQTTQTVRSGDVAMNRTVDGILTIRETVSETSEKVKRLEESTQKISKVVGLIGRFAAQTHMLALKASIEAARAGDEGQGFAVIADEVRSLAAQSAEATAEIGNLVTIIQSETGEVAIAMQAGTEQVLKGTKLVEETRQTLTQIGSASEQIDALVRAIAKSTEEQSQASQAVSQTMTEVAAISTQTSTEASHVSESFKDILTLAQSLQKSVGQFKVE